MKPTDNIFRHLRPLNFVPSRVVLKPSTYGGISFMLKPTSEKMYDYWVCICPENIPFSTKHAVSSLRHAADRMTHPWGTINLSGDVLINQLLDSVMTEIEHLPTQVATQVQNILKHNDIEGRKLSSAMISSLDTRRKYEEN